MKQIAGLVFLLCTLGCRLWAQDPQLSQYYANRLFVNPAFAGSAEQSMLSVSARDQYTVIDQGYRTVALGFDTPFYVGRTRHGFGLSLLGDEAGAGPLKRAEAQVHYAFYIPFSDKSYLSLGLSGGLLQTSVNYLGLIFPDQYTPGAGTTVGSADDPILKGLQSKIVPDFATGLLYYNGGFYLSAAIFHLNQPHPYATIGAQDNKIPSNTLLNVGYKIPLARQGYADEDAPKPELVLTTLYRRQGISSNLDVGSYVTLPPIQLGVWYRGLVKEHISPAIVGIIGITVKNVRIGYSYDYTTGDLGAARAGSTHELSLNLTLGEPQHRTNRRVNFPCPKF